MTRKFCVVWDTKNGGQYYHGTANDLLKVIKYLEDREAVSLYGSRPILRTGRMYMLVLKDGTYTVYRED